MLKELMNLAKRQTKLDDGIMKKKWKKFGKNGE
jgi:hypothetical protein